MLKEVDHIAIAVRDLSVANETFSRLLGCAPYKQERLLAQSVAVSFFQLGNVKIELIAGIGSSHPLKGFLEKRGEGLHHIAFSVSSALSGMRHLESLGFKALSKSPSMGGNHKEVIFFHPKEAHGTLVELCASRT